MLLLLDISVKGIREKSISRINAVHKEIIDSNSHKQNKVGCKFQNKIGEVQKLVSENNIEFVTLDSTNME